MIIAGNEANLNDSDPLSSQRSVLSCCTALYVPSTCSVPWSQSCTFLGRAQAHNQCHAHAIGTPLARYVGTRLTIPPVYSHKISQFPSIMCWKKKISFMCGGTCLNSQWLTNYSNTLFCIPSIMTSLKSCGVPLIKVASLLYCLKSFLLLTNTVHFCGLFLVFPQH